MEIITLIADIAGTIGMGFFLKAEIQQLYKILKTKIVEGISHTAYRDKLLAIIATSTCFWLSSLWLSLAVLIAEGIIALIILCLMKKYRRKTLSKEIKKW